MGDKNNLTKKYELIPSVDKGSHRDTKWFYKIEHVINRFRINKMASWLTILFPKTSNFTFPPDKHCSAFTICFQKDFKIREFSFLKNNVMFMVYSGEDINKTFLTLILMCLQTVHIRDLLQLYFSGKLNSFLRKWLMANHTKKKLVILSSLL